MSETTLLLDEIPAFLSWLSDADWKLRLREDVPPVLTCENMFAEIDVSILPILCTEPAIDGKLGRLIFREVEIIITSFNPKEGNGE